MKFSSYQTESHYDEYFKDNGIPRSAMAPFVKRIDQLSKKEILRRKSAAESALLQAGITFTIYGEQQGQIDRIFPFDIIPRIIAPDDWDVIERGLKQRIYALNQFINDIYNEKKIIKDNCILAKKSGAILPVPISLETLTANSMSWKITLDVLPACPMCWRTGKSSSVPSP